MSRNMPYRTMGRFAALLLTLGLVTAMGCGDDATRVEAPGGDATQGTYALEDSRHTRNVRVFDNVKRLTDRAAQAVYIEGDTLVFPTAVADDLQVYEPGDIMATAAGQGLLRRVERIDWHADPIVVHTSSASLADVFASGEIYFAANAEPNVEVPESFRYEPMTGEYGVRQQPLELDWNDTLFSWNKDFASDLNARIGSSHFMVDEASLNFDVGGEFYVDAGAQVWPPSVDLKSLRAGANGTANATLRVRLESSDAFDFSETYYLVSTQPANQPLVSLNEQTADIANLVRLTFNADAILELNASAGGTISATGEVQLNGTVAGGLERKNGVWQTYTGASVAPSGYGPAFDGEKSFTASAKLTTTMRVDVSNAATGSLVVHPAILTADFSQQIDASSGECPTHFNINVTGKVSGQLESISVLGYDIGIMDGPSNWTMYDKNYLTHDGQLQLAGVCDPNYQPPAFGTGARFEGMMCREDDDCRTGISCFRDTCVTEGPIRFSVAWFEDTDVDIQVTTPSGNVVDWLDFSSGDVDGLVYDFPNCTGKCTGPGPYVESIYSIGPPQPGIYIVEIVHEAARADSAFALTIEHDGDVRHEGGNLPGEGESVTFQYEVK